MDSQRAVTGMADEDDSFDEHRERADSDYRLVFSFDDSQGMLDLLVFDLDEAGPPVDRCTVGADLDGEALEQAAADLLGDDDYEESEKSAHEMVRDFRDSLAPPDSRPDEHVDCDDAIISGDASVDLDEARERIRKLIDLYRDRGDLTDEETGRIRGYRNALRLIGGDER